MQCLYLLLALFIWQQSEHWLLLLLLLLPCCCHKLLYNSVLPVCLFLLRSFVIFHSDLICWEFYQFIFQSFMILPIIKSKTSNLFEIADWFSFCFSLLVVLGSSLVNFDGTTTWHASLVRQLHRNITLFSSFIIISFKC